MKINFDTELLDLDGKAIKAQDKKALTLKKACVDAALAMTDSDKGMDGIKKFEMYELAMKLNKGGEISLKAEDIALLKKRIGMVYLPLIVGRCYELLEKQ